MRLVFLACSALLLAGTYANAQPRPEAADAQVQFDNKVRTWDGFGVNYVEAAQTRDYRKRPQEYGGFSTLSEEKRRQILDMIFGPDGLKPGIVKMFLDSLHEGMSESDNDNGDPNVTDMSRFDHKTTTKWMRYFVREGLERTRARGADLQIITTLYGPPDGLPSRNSFGAAISISPKRKKSPST